jgi:hypothetical protein
LFGSALLPFLCRGTKILSLQILGKFPLLKIKLKSFVKGSNIEGIAFFSISISKNQIGFMEKNQTADHIFTLKSIIDSYKSKKEKSVCLFH